LRVATGTRGRMLYGPRPAWYPRGKNLQVNALGLSAAVPRARILVNSNFSSWTSLKSMGQPELQPGRNARVWLRSPYRPGETPSRSKARCCGSSGRRSAEDVAGILPPSPLAACLASSRGANPPAHLSLPASAPFARPPGTARDGPRAPGEAATHALRAGTEGARLRPPPQS
jgi:hypothetical protein